MTTGPRAPEPRDDRRDEEERPDAPTSPAPADSETTAPLMPPRAEGASAPTEVLSEPLDSAAREWAAGSATTDRPEAGSARTAPPVPPPPPASASASAAAGSAAPPRDPAATRTSRGTERAPVPSAQPGGPRSGPIVWGALILVFCAYLAQRTFGAGVDTTSWIIGTIIGVGVLLLVVGGAILIRNRAR